MIFLPGPLLPIVVGTCSILDPRAALASASSTPIARRTRGSRAD
ncbi:MAG: hypothetical protein ABJE95_34440 [Byssovorax sp.]